MGIGFGIGDIDVYYWMMFGLCEVGMYLVMCYVGVVVCGGWIGEEVVWFVGFLVGCCDELGEGFVCYFGLGDCIGVGDYDGLCWLFVCGVDCGIVYCVGFGGIVVSDELVGFYMDYFGYDWVGMCC